MKFVIICLPLFLNSVLGIEDEPEFVANVTESQQGTPDIHIKISPGIVAAIGANIEEDEEPIKNVDLYIMADISKMNEHQRRKVAAAVAEMIDELKSSNSTNQVRLALGTLVNRNIGSHHGTSLRERRKKHKAAKSLRKAHKMLRHCHGKKCMKWYRLKQFHERQLTPIIQTSYRHQMNFTEDTEEMIRVFANATKRGVSHQVSSQWEAMIQASSCPDVADWSNDSQKILLYINADGILEPQAYNHRRLSRTGLRCSGSNHTLPHKHDNGRSHHVKLTNGKIAQYLMEGRVRLLVGVPFSKKAFITKRIFKSVPYSEVFAFGRSFATFGEKAATKVESMVNNKNGIIHNAPYPLIVRNVARPCTKRQLKKAAKKNKPITCSEDGGQGWNITVELNRCSRRRPIDNTIYFNIWIYTYNAVLNVNTTVLCPKGNESDAVLFEEDDDSEIAALNEGEGDVAEAVTEDPDEATEKDVDFVVEAEMTPVPEVGEFDEEPPHEPDAEVIEPDTEVIRDTDLEVPDKEESGTCLSVRDCVFCNFMGDRDRENCGECKMEFSSDPEEISDSEKCKIKLDDNCMIEYYILPEPNPQVIGGMKCFSPDDEDEDDNEIIS